MTFPELVTASLQAAGAWEVKDHIRAPRFKMLLSLLLALLPWVCGHSMCYRSVCQVQRHTIMPHAAVAPPGQSLSSGMHEPQAGGGMDWPIGAGCSTAWERRLKRGASEVGRCAHAGPRRTHIISCQGAPRPPAPAACSVTAAWHYTTPELRGGRMLTHGLCGNVSPSMCEGICPCTLLGAAHTPAAIRNLLTGQRGGLCGHTAAAQLPRNRFCLPA